MKDKTVRRGQQGMTLMELVVTLAIVGLLTAIALPGYQGHIVKARRDQAIGQLLQWHLIQQSYRLRNPHFASTEAIEPPKSEYFEFSVEKAGVNELILVAAAKGDQRQDTQCLTLKIDLAMQRWPKPCWE